MGGRGEAEHRLPSAFLPTLTPTRFALMCVCIGITRKVCVETDSAAKACQGGERGLRELDSVIGAGTFSSLRSCSRFVVLYMKRLGVV